MQVISTEIAGVREIRPVRHRDPRGFFSEIFREDVLRRADIVSLHINLTPETRGFINTKTIALMKQDAILINTARGGVVVEHHTNWPMSMA